MSHSGVLASSKSASHTFAPEFSALIVIFLSVGPVISTRRSTRPGAGSATRQDRSSRMSLVFTRKSSVPPSASARCRSCLAASSSLRRSLSSRCKVATRRSASSVRISSYLGAIRPVICTPSMSVTFAPPASSLHPRNPRHPATAAPGRSHPALPTAASPSPGAAGRPTSITPRSSRRPPRRGRAPVSGGRPALTGPLGLLHKIDGRFCVT